MNLLRHTLFKKKPSNRHPRTFTVTFLNNRTHVEHKVPVLVFGGFKDARQRAWEGLATEMWLFPEDFSPGSKITDYSLVLITHKGKP